MENNFDKFVEEITQKLQENLGKEYQIEMKEVQGINGTVKHSLILIQKGRDIHPCVNLDTYYDEYNAGTGMESLVEIILEGCREESPIKLSAILDFTDWENVKPYIYAKLINTEKNRPLLLNIPNRAYLDLSLVYYVRMESLVDEKYAVIQVSNEYMGYWGIEENTLFESAWENMITPNEAAVENIADILKPFFYKKELQKEDGENDIQMYVLSNRRCSNGAVQMCNRKALKEAAEMIGGDLWILPSSVHEVILIPIRKTEDCAEGLAEIVKEINDTQLDAQDILSYHVYRYSKKSGEITIVA